MDATVTVSVEEYTKLIQARTKLQCLENCGVDNWSGYDEAMEDYHREIDVE